MAENIAKGLKCNIRHKVWFTNKEGTIFISNYFWHLMELIKPSDIDSKYKLWKLENLPLFFDLNDNSMYKIKEWKSESWFKNSSKDRIELLISFIKDNLSKWLEFYHAWDPDREWELISRLVVNYIKNYFKEKENIDLDKELSGEYRLWVNKFTNKTLTKELEDKKDISLYDNLYKSALTRSHSDRFVWMNLSSYYTLLTGDYKNILNVWRVQTAFLRIVYDNEIEIKNFENKTTFKMLWHFSKDNSDEFIAEWFSEKIKNGRIENKNIYDFIKKDLDSKQDNEFTVVENKSVLKEEKIKEIYSMDALVEDAEKKLKFNIEKTQDIYQELYEKKKILSYPRNDNWFLTNEDYKNLEDSIYTMTTHPKYGEYISQLISAWKINPNKDFVDDSQVWAHSWLHFLIPDSENNDTTWNNNWIIDTYNQLNSDEKKLFDLILERTLAVFETPYAYESSEIVLNKDKHFFRIRWKVLKDKGWKRIYWQSDNKDVILPNLKEWDVCNLLKIEEHKVLSKPPARYTEWKLFSSVSDLAKLVKDNKELSKRIKAISPWWDRQLWLWTSWTKKEIIKSLNDNWFTEIKKWKIYMTDKWYKLISIIDPKFSDVVTTAKWEDNIKKIEEGKYTYDEFINSLKKDIEKVISEKTPKSNIKNNYKPLNKASLWICPKCWIWDIKSWEKWYSCSCPKCDFILWKNSYNKEFKEKEIKSLLSDWKLECVKMYSEKKSKTYDANFRLNKDTFKLEMYF